VPLLSTKHKLNFALFLHFQQLFIIITLLLYYNYFNCSWFFFCCRCYSHTFCSLPRSRTLNSTRLTNLWLVAPTCIK